MPDGSASHDQCIIPAAETRRALRDAFGRFATGVTLVTTGGDDGPVGFTANSFSSLSLDPPLVLWSPARSARRFPVFAAARHFAIHVVPATAADWPARFAREGQGFAGLPHAVNDEGVPVIAGALARFDCVHHASFDGGDHLIIVGRVLRAMLSEGDPLVFSQGRYGGFLPD